MTTAHVLRRESGWEDPLLAGYDLPYKRTFFPLGFPVTIETNSEYVLQAAHESWSVFGQEFDEDPISLSIGVCETACAILPRPPIFRARNHLLSIVSDPDNFISCDLVRGYEFGWIGQTLAEESAYFRYYFLDVAVLTAIQQKYLAPLHGACVTQDGRGVLLCGTSSAGKSTLAYACSRSGWTYVADDATFLVRSEPHCSAIGNCHSIRFRENSKRFFPELFHLTPSLRPNGTHRIEAPTQNLPITTAFSTKISHVVFLDRSDPGPARLTSVSSREEALDWFSSFACYGEESVRLAQRSCYEKLLARGFWRLHYKSLDEAVLLLGRLTDPDQS